MSLVSRVIEFVQAVGADIKALRTGKEDALPSGSTNNTYLRGGTKTWVDLATSVRGILLTGLNLTISTVVSTGDTVLGALGKLQAQITKVIGLAPLPTDTAKTFTWTPGTGWVEAVAGGGGSTPLLMHLQDQRAAGTNRGTDGNVFSARTLNTVVLNQIAGATLTGSVVSLPAGTYFMQASTAIIGTGSSKVRIRNTTAAVTLVVGSTDSFGTASIRKAICSGQVILTATSNIRFEGVVATPGQAGAASNTGDVEVFSELLIWKLQ